MKNPKPKPPRVRIARPDGRPFQLRYFSADENREVRISTGTRDEAEADQQKRELEAKLLLGMPTKSRRVADGPHMPWSEFRHEYSETQLVTLRPRSRINAESRLDIAERIMRPRTLADMADSAALHRLQARLQAGAHGRDGRPRAAFTVKNYMRAVLASLNWAHVQGWLPSRPAIKLVKVSKLKHMRGRPLATEEFERLLMVVERALTVKSSAPKTRNGKPVKQRTDREPRKPSPEIVTTWQGILSALWESGLRIEELMHLSWDRPGTIRPVWQRGRLPVLEIPADMQKNATEEAIPLLPGFESLLLATPEAERTGWIFTPTPLQPVLGRRIRQPRPDVSWVGKVISRIGKAAGVIVDPGNPETGKPASYASAHDLRRSCLDRLKDAGIPMEVIQAVARHADYRTTQ
ncbi:MAG: site-specific integrase, partial [Planctomycetia bacterium]|nr:site-specific integrase [Planctomycetia bacterium]